MKKSVAMRKDVAKLANVSETIVSYVINENRYVKKEKKERVYAAMEELNYRPNIFARALKGKKPKQILMLSDHIRTEYYGELISAMEKYSADMGYLMSVSIISNTLEYVNRIIELQVEAVIVISIRFSQKYIQKLIDAGIMVVLMKNRRYDNVKGACSINTGLYQATKDGISYLYNAGCNNIAYADRVSDTNSFSDMTDFRYAGYCEMMDELGLEKNKCIITGCTCVEELQEKILANVKQKKIDAIFARNDNVALVAMNALLRHGYAVPGDVSVIGFDDTRGARTSIPTLSSMRMKKDDIAKTAIKMIEDYYNGTSVPDETLFIPELIIRESVAPKNK